MRVQFVVIVLLLAACGKEDDMVKLTSVTGTWAYTTPDNKIKVTFDLVENSTSNVDLENLHFELEGVEYNSASQLTGVDLPQIETIRFNLNDSEAVYPYFIQFNESTVNADYTIINCISASYTWPWGTEKKLEFIQITRVE